MDDVSSAPKVDKAKMEEPVMPVQAHTLVNDYEVDYEKHGADRDSNPYPDLKRKLKSRHLQMIAIGEWCLSRAGKDFPILIEFLHRWHDRNGSVHRERHGRCLWRACWSPNRLYLCRNHCVFGHDGAG